MNATLSHEEKMILLEALNMMETWLDFAGHDWTDEDHAKFMNALRVIGPID